jgi:peptidoglycan/xylan/chitin deacetylase (PgdA/CDA1 family)
MLRIDIHFVIRRYEIILVLIVLLLTGSIVVSAPEKEFGGRSSERYPYAIALTFDDGPHPYYTARIVSLLKEYNARATFFLVGRLALEYPVMVQALSLSGDEIASHSFTHRNLSHLSGAEVARELVSTRRVIEDITGRACPYFRPPGGQYNAKVVMAAESIGQQMVLWSVFPKDHEADDPGVVVDRVLAQAHDGGIVLLHSGKETTLQALPVILKELRKKGYSFVTVSEILNRHIQVVKK